MNTFMGPMTPPPASPGQPQKLDIRTNPNQRAGFKQFMKQRTAPAVMPIQQMPQAQPMPMPMMQPRPQMPLRMEMGGDVDIFDPQNYHEGGLVNTLGQLGTMSGQMVDALNTIVMGGGQGGGATSGFDSGSGFTSTPSVSSTTSSVTNPNVLSPSGGQTDPQAILNSQIDQMPERGQDFFGMLGPSGNAPMDDPNTPQNEYQDFLNSGVSDTGNPFTTSGPFGEINPDDFKVVEPLRETFGMKDGGAVPPRNTNIGGQPHMLSYITPDEADILEALGGAGEAGPMGIPAFYDEGEPESEGGDQTGDDVAEMSRDESDRDEGAQRDRETLAKARADLAASQAAQDERDRQAAADLREQQRRDEISRMQDRVQAGLAREDLVTSPGVTTPETTITATSAPNRDVSNIAAVGETDPDDDTDAGGIETTDLLGVDDLLSLDPRNDIAPAPRSTPAVAVGPLSGPTTAAEKAQAEADARAAGTGMDDEYDDLTKEEERARNIGYTDAGLPRGLEFVNVKRPDGRTVRVTTNLAGTTQAQREAMPGYMSTRDPANPISGEVKKGLVPSVVDLLTGNPVTQAYGFEIPDYDQKNPDASTGEITGMIGPPNINVPGMLSSGLSLIEDIFLDDPSTYGSSAELLTGMTPSVYTGYGPGSVPPPDSGSGGPDPVKQPFDPCPDGFFLKDGVCTPIETDTGDGTPNQIGGGPDQPPPVPGGPVVVPSTRPTGPFNLQGPVGYGVPTAGMADPSVATNAALYQQMLNQQAAAPIRLQSGGPVSSNLDRAADNFLKSLMPTA